MENNTLKITVITVCYNTVETIEETILSVINQTYENIEYVIIDGGSMDGTVDVIKKYSDRISYWISEPDMGIYDAMNKGIKAATGDYINFMNAGDSFYENSVLESVACSIDRKAVIVYGQLMKIFNRFRFISVPKAINLEDMRGDTRLPHQAMFARTDYQKAHPFDTSYRSAADFKFYFNAYFTDKCKFQFLPFLIANYDSETGMSKDSHIGIVESMRVQGREINEIQKKRLIQKYKIINFLKEYLPEFIITEIRKRKFSNAGYQIINNYHDCATRK